MPLTNNQLNAQLAGMFQTMFPTVPDLWHFDSQEYEAFVMYIVARLEAYAQSGGPGSPQFEAATTLLRRIAEWLKGSSTLTALELHLINTHWQSTVTVT